jgi:hypothetical protein
VSYDEALEMLRRKGFEIEWGDDFGADEERALVAEFERPFFIPEFPARITAFYYMLDRDNPEIAHRIDMHETQNTFNLRHMRHTHRLCLTADRRFYWDNSRVYSSRVF